MSCAKPEDHKIWGHWDALPLDEFTRNIVKISLLHYLMIMIIIKAITANLIINMAHFVLDRMFASKWLLY